MAERVEMEITFDSGKVSSHYSPDTISVGDESFASFSEFGTTKKDQKKYILLFVEFLLVTFLSACILWIFSLPYCGFIFKCGCTWRWNGGANECNAFQHDDIDKCPVCIAPRIVIGASHIITIAIMVASYFGSKYIAQRYSSKIFQRKEETSFAEESSEDDLLASYSFTYEKKSAKWEWLKKFAFVVSAGITLVFTFIVVVFVIYLLFFIASDYPTFIFE